MICFENVKFPGFYLGFKSERFECCECLNPCVGPLCCRFRDARSPLLNASFASSLHPNAPCSMHAADGLWLCTDCSCEPKTWWRASIFDENIVVAPRPKCEFERDLIPYCP